MKKLVKLIPILLIGAVSLSVSSCLGDDDSSTDYSITNEEYTSLLTQMAGSYAGQLYFYNDTLSTTNKTDSTYMNYVAVRGVGDSTIVAQVPVRYLVKGVDNQAEMHEAIDDLDEEVSITMKYYLYQQSSGYVVFGLYPQTVTYYYTYDGEDHDLVFDFYRYTNVNGQYASGQMLADFYLTSVKLDGTQVASYNVGTYNTDSNSIYRLYIKK